MVLSPGQVEGEGREGRHSQSPQESPGGDEDDGNCSQVF